MNILDVVQKATTQLVTHWKKEEYPSVKYPVDILMGISVLFFLAWLLFK